MSSRTRAKSQTKKPRKGKKATPTQKLINRIGLVVVIAFVAFCLVVLFSTPPAEAPTQPQYDGQPWQYDERFDMHWDPRPGHQHWHEGKPPPEDER